MPGKEPPVNPLELRKQILIAESELNRAQLLGDMAALTTEFRALTDRARSFNTIASSAALLVTGLAAFRHNKSVPSDAKPSFLQKCLKGAGMVSTLWLAVRSRGGERKDK